MGTGGEGEPARMSAHDEGARASQDRPKSPRQSLRQALATDQVDPRALEQASSTDFVDRNGSKIARKSNFG